jgi:hypothetical protein
VRRSLRGLRPAGIAGVFPDARTSDRGTRAWARRPAHSDSVTTARHPVIASEGVHEQAGKPGPDTFAEPRLGRPALRVRREQLHVCQEKVLASRRRVHGFSHALTPLVRYRLGPDARRSLE